MRQQYDSKTWEFFVSQVHGKYEGLVKKLHDIDVDILLNFVKSEGKYQYLIVLLASVMAIAMSMGMYSSSFLLADPTFKCYEGTKLVSCKEAVFNKLYCPDKYNEDQIDWKFNSWAKEGN